MIQAREKTDASAELHSARMSFVRFLERRTALSDPRISSRFRIYGNGYVGDKMHGLMVRTPQILEAGFYMDPRSILAMDFFNDYFERNGLGKEERTSLTGAERVKRALTGEFSGREKDVLGEIGDEFGNRALLVRSSAYGDARGTGVYESAPCFNDPPLLRTAVRIVLASHFTENAETFRRMAHLPEGIAVSIERAVGNTVNCRMDHVPIDVKRKHYGYQEYEEYLGPRKRESKSYKCFAPFLSGHGYTSTSYCGGYVHAFYGFCQPLSRGGYRAYSSRKGKSFSEVEEIWWNYYHGDVDWTGKFNEGVVLEDGETNSGQFPDFRMNHMVPRMVRRDSIDFDISGFFTSMGILEALCGRPQYFEWAVKLEEEGFGVHIVQVDDADIKTDSLEFRENPDSYIANAIFVRGTGVRDCNSVVFFNNIGELERISRFNKHHKNYILIVDFEKVGEKFSLKSISNAAVVLEKPYADHVNHPSEHYMGQNEMTGILFGVIERGFLLPEHAKPISERYGLEGFYLEMRVTSSEAQQKLIVEAA